MTLAPELEPREPAALVGGMLSLPGARQPIDGERHPLAETVRLVCAVSDDERRLFLERLADALADLPVEVTWADERNRGGGGMTADIYLTGWSTNARHLRSVLAGSGCKVRYVCHLTGSVRHFVPREFIARGGWVTNWGDIPARTVAEHALLLAMAALRNLPAWPAADRHFNDTIRRIELLGTRTLFGRRVGIHGFGRVARALVPLLRPFGVELHAWSGGVPAEHMQALGVTPGVSLEALFRRSEVLFECEGLTPGTVGMITAPLLRLLPNGAVFVNVGRGPIVDEAALRREIASGRMSAALDVVGTEAPEQARAELRAAGAVLSPHIAGPTFDQYDDLGGFALANVRRFVRGEALQGVVTLEDYDRAT